jgi:hypothetical protein
VGAAEEIGLLEKEYANSCGRALGLFRRGRVVREEVTAEQVAAILRRHRRRLLGEYSNPVLADIGLPVETDETQETAARVGDGDPDGKTLEAEIKPRGVVDARLVRFVRAAAEPPRASDIATMLLIAQSLPDEPPAHRGLLEVLWQSRPIITISAQARGFEEAFLDLLTRGLILPGNVSRCDGYCLAVRDLFRFTHVTDPKWQIVTFAGREWEETSVGVGKAAQGAYPMLGISETEGRLPGKLVDAAHLNLSCGGLNADIVRRTIEEVLGEAPSDNLYDIDFSRIEIADLACAIRPGISASRAVATLRKFAASSGDGSVTDGGVDEKPSESGKTGSTSSSSSKRRGADPGSGSSLIRPAERSDAKAVWIERLSGYGEAQDWAAGLKEDLPLWRDGTIGWEEMSTRILLYGPPGTGKTMFARALANSLQVPLLATSVARWLEPSYLGEVVRRMKGAFIEAEAHKPVILFIDEIDGIGARRTSSQDHSDYWNTVVNQFLDLLDGALKSVGVIVVGATNRRGSIDPAVLRSGRLERHVEIPLPDVDALTGILRHHLRDDLEAVIADAPKATSGGGPSEADLQTLAQELGRLPDDVLRRLADL